ncbi:RHS repeat-associated core domain-containing protein [Vibrio viridaestus]|uniref:Rhs family protein n=1 Tax=Vibrio viridaestus TaxID=2487322 RepID=A0A3N9TIA3_9VIBR|nr:RHS repeat-associated core domain-containing protein [Vibrio viridaestus]RQW63623.1 Rhs family protein [Vibrio viridaestus]
MKVFKIIDELEELFKLVTRSSDKAFSSLEKATRHHEGGLSTIRKKTQDIEGKHVEDASGFAADAKQSTEVVTDSTRTTHNESSRNNNGETVDDTQNTVKEGCPVSMVTGEELLTIEDVSLPGSIPFTFKREYRTTACEINVGLGYGWSHTLAHHLEFKDGSVFWHDDENKVTTLPEPTEQSPEIYNDLASSAIFLGTEEGEFILASAGKPFLHFKRDGDIGRLSGFSDNYSNRLNVEYDENNRVNAVINPLGIALWFSYHNDLISQIELKTAKQTEQGRVWISEHVLHHYLYNDSEQLIADRNGLDEGEDYQYDEQNIISLRRMAGGVEFGWKWDGEGKSVRCTEHWSNTGYQSTFIWDDEKRSVNVVYSDQSVASYTHDENAKLVKTSDPDGAETVNTYDDNGNLLSTVDALGNEIKHVYNKDGQRKATIQPDGTVIRFSYIDGKLFRVMVGDAKWRYLYNRQGDMVQKMDPLRNTTDYRYDKQGNLTEIIYADGSKHQLNWNKLGMLIGENYPDGSETLYRYDILGRMIYERSSIGGVTQYSWDAADRLVKIDKPDGKSKRFEYNAYGKVTQVVDEHGNKTEYEYQKNSHLVSRVVNPDGTSLRYQYDNAKRFVSQITNERGERHSIDYYTNGLVERETTFDGRQFVYEYDLLGKVTKKTEIGTEGTELVTEFKRDPMGRLVSKTLADGREIEYRYDQYGQLAEMDDGVTPLAWRYDLMGHVTEEHQGWASHYFSYDELGQVTDWQLPDAKLISYQRGKGGVLSKINLNNELLTQHVYQNGLEKQRQQGNVVSTFSHDEQGRLVSQKQQIGQKTQRKRQYQYDSLGNLSQIHDTRDGDFHFDYDPLSRLTAVRGNIEERFVHDETGNLLTQTLGNQINENRSRAAGNQLSFHGDTHYEYDEFGRLTEERRGKNQSLVTKYDYDCQHRLIKASMPDGSTANYTYDAFGRRIKKVVTNKLGETSTTEFVWQGDNLVAELKDSKEYQTYLYEPGTFKPLALIKGEGKEAEVFHYHLDQIGTPIDITDTNGSSVWSVQYRAYGNVVRKHVETIANPLRFQGQYCDTETGLHYNRHRYYSPDTGRFTTVDPIGLAGGLNNYQYVPNPTGWVDPLGLASVPGDCPVGKSSQSNSVNFNQNIKKHLTTVDGFSQQKGVIGGHNLDAFNEIASEKNLKIISNDQHPTMEGISQVEYQIPSFDREGNMTGYKNKVFTKTLYDPNVISDDKIYDLGVKAAESGYSQAVSQGLSAYSAIADGIKIRVYIRNSQVDNFHPEF